MIKASRGSFEHFASASSIVRRYGEVTGHGVKPGAGRITCKEIFELSYENVPEAVRVVNENAGMVGIGLANLITIFAPEIIVLGGGMTDARDSYISMIKKSAFENTLENCRAGVRIEKAHLGTSGSVLGSAYWSMASLAGQSI